MLTHIVLDRQYTVEDKQLLCNDEICDEGRPEVTHRAAAVDFLTWTYF